MARELRDGVWWFDLGGVNAYLAEDDEGLTLVDAGMPWDAGAVRDGIADAGYAVADLDRVLVTHYDPDHVGGLKRLDVDCPVYVGAGDAPKLSGERAPPVTRWKSLLQRVFRPFVQPSGLDVRPVADGDTVGSFTVYETPGHTDGHVCYVSETLDVAFLGDLVRSADGELVTPPWLLSANMRKVRESIYDLTERAPDFAAACPGHGRPFRERGADALRNARE